MRVTTVSQMKGSARKPPSDVPREGTIVRLIHDELLQNRGRWFTPSRVRDRAAVVRQLRDFYGLDIECSTGNESTMFRLRGEYFGHVYVSYLNAK